MLSLTAIEQRRFEIFDFRAIGFQKEETFGFWPMLFGGLFLYFSYYGCDQSQTQRLLTTETVKEARRSLIMNSLIRFPLVLSYCAFGILLIPYLAQNQFLAEKMKHAPPDYLVPYFLLEYVPHGFLGLIVSGIFAASMSSLDSALNSLSASTWRDLISTCSRSAVRWTSRQQVLFSRFLTVMWGVVCTVFALLLIHTPDTVIELINKIGSLFYGPVAAVFVLGILTRSPNQSAAVTGLVSGVGMNLALWLFAGTSVSWLWWNPFGFIVTFLGGTVSSRWYNRKTIIISEITGLTGSDSFIDRMPFYASILTGFFFLILLLSLIIEFFIPVFFN